MMKKFTLSAVAMLFLAGMLSAQVNEQSPVFSKSVNSVKGVFDVLTTFNTVMPGEQAVETDGMYIYTAMWQTSGMIRKYNSLTGAIVDSFTITGVDAGIRDLCYDGTYFYGRAGAAGTSIYKMDFTAKTLVSTISLGKTVRHLCYDPTLDGGNGGFWAGDWALLSSHKKDGTLIADITVPTGFASNYGSHFDNTTAGGPYLWFFNQDATAPKVDLVQYHIGTNTIVSTHDCSNVPGIDATNALAGGLGGSSTAIPGKFVLVANVQQDPNLIIVFDMGSVGINDPESAGKFTLYPNPATTQLNLNADSPINQLTVFNAVGQMVENITANSMNYSLNTSSYQPGVYFVQIASEKGTSTRKFIVSE